MSEKPFIDYSQYSTWIKCEMYWLERYLLSYRKPPKEGQKDDAQTLGTLVHAGLQTLRESGKIDIPESAITASQPTPECLAWAQNLLLGYIQTYPQEQWAEYHCEDPLRFPLRDDFSGLAKVDSYFALEGHQVVESGLGDSLSLEPGWWVHEYKTKAASRDVGNYVLGWRMNMQPSFQMLALQALTGEPCRGVLINVLDKPQEYVPKRTCKGCGGKYELADWLPTGAGYACPACANIQELEPYRPKVERKPEYYRIKVERSQERLARDLEQISLVGERMHALRLVTAASLGEVAGGRAAASDSLELLRGYTCTATERCVDGLWGPCEYFPAHSEGLFAQALPQTFVHHDPLVYIK